MYYYFVLLNSHGCELATSEKFPVTGSRMTEELINFVRDAYGFSVAEVGDQIVVRETDWSNP